MFKAKATLGDALANTVHMKLIEVDVLVKATSLSSLVPLDH